LSEQDAFVEIFERHARCIRQAGYYLFCIATLHRGTISAITRSRNLPCNGRYGACYIIRLNILPIFRSFQIIMLRRESERVKKKFLTIYFRRIDFSSLQLSRFGEADLWCAHRKFQ